MGHIAAEMPGAMVLSLDFELIWGVRDLYTTEHPYMLKIINERRIIPGILDLFEEYDIAATWATVGFMFAKTQRELREFSPRKKPLYKNSGLNPYHETVGEGEWDDPLHYAHYLIKQIGKRKGQEIATHTYSHYYCLEEGQTRETFADDLDSAIALAQKYGMQLRSIVFPRNQYNPDYDDILLSRGIKCFRGTEGHPAYQVKGYRQSRMPCNRLYRLADSFFNLSGTHLVSWENVRTAKGLFNIPSSRYLRPIAKSSFFKGMMMKRIASAMDQAAKSKMIFHLWTHPQDFGLQPDENLKGLRQILEVYKCLKKKYGMVSLNMLGAAELAHHTMPGN